MQLSTAKSAAASLSLRDYKNVIENNRTRDKKASYSLVIAGSTL